jgi:glycosyltransferase involved in cell wall biosynthesis
MRILIATTQVPFVTGGAEGLAEGLRDALRCAGHEAEIVRIPFKWYPAEQIVNQMLACRLLDLTQSAGTPVDLLIGLKFPAYLIPHPNKILWILHQHRAAYELWEHPLSDLIHAPDGLLVRDAIRHADQRIIPEAKRIFALSRNVAARLEKFCSIEATPLYAPVPGAEKFYCAAAEEYLFYPSRLSHAKRQSFVLEALAECCEPVRVRFAGATEHAPYFEELKLMAARLGVEHQIEWLGAVTEDEKHKLYAHAIAVVFPPLDEDYGYVTLEAMLAAKPVITCADSGGPLEFVRAEMNGLVAEATPQSLARAMDRVWADRASAKRWGEAGRAHYESLNLTWPETVHKLLA